MMGLRDTSLLVPFITVDTSLLVPFITVQPVLPGDNRHGGLGVKNVKHVPFLAAKIMNTIFAFRAL